jgi:hypothetical protein
MYMPLSNKEKVVLPHNLWTQYIKRYKGYIKRSTELSQQHIMGTWHQYMNSGILYYNVLVFSSYPVSRIPYPSSVFSSSLTHQAVISVPAMHAVRREAMAPPIHALKMTLAKSLLRSGHMEERTARPTPNADGWEKPQRA